MKKLVCLLFVLLCAFNTMAQGWEWGRWAKRGSNNQIGYSELPFCAVDRYGSVYGAGGFWGSVTFPSDTVTTNSGTAALMLVKYDSMGNLRWLTGSNSQGIMLPLGITVDVYDDIYVLGAYDSAFTVRNYSFTNPIYGRYQYYVAKIDTAGNVLWIKGIGTVQSKYFPQGDITTDNSGNVFLTCSFNNQPVIGAINIVKPSADTTDDILVAKFDSSGAVQWAKSFGGNNTEQGMNLSVAPSGNIYVSGVFYSDSMNIGNDIVRDSSAALHYWSLFLAQLDQNGDPVWARGSLGIGNYYSYAMTVDANENIFLAGTYDGSSMLLDTASLPAPPGLSKYGFLSKFNSSGTIVWLKPILGTATFPFDAAVDPCGNIWLLCGYGGNVNDTIDGHAIIAPAGFGQPNFLAGWSNNGNFINAAVLQSGSLDDRNGMAIDNNGHIFVVAEQESCSVMVVGNDTNINDGEDAFVAKFDPGLNCVEQASLLKKYKSVLSLFPNPATSTLTIQYTGVTKNATTSIYDITGRLMGAYPLTGSTTTISVQYLPPGLYQCRVNDGAGNVATKKLVIMR
jgi:hypothetical protein